MRTLTGIYLLVLAATACAGPDSAPEIAWFTVSPAQVGDRVASWVTWRWAYSDSRNPRATCTIDGGIGTMVSGGSSLVELTAARTFTLTCANDAGTRSATVALATAAQPAPTAQQQLFIRLFGERDVTFDAAAVAEVLALPAGKKVYRDTDGDGRVDTAYFIDDDPRHTAPHRPILVKIIDRDGDLARTGGGDTHSDRYIADWNADGTVDAVVDYVDSDGDGRLDEMGIYDVQSGAAHVWWSRDIGHSHQLWSTVNYHYEQPLSQWASHFNGDEEFASFTFDETRGLWVPGFEDPFAFYDEDGDGQSDIVVRIATQDQTLQSMRYSFGLSRDAAPDLLGDTHDYDFSLTCLAPAPVTLPPESTESIELAGAPAAPILKWSAVREFGLSAPWGRVELAWVENDNNVDPNPAAVQRERWEGVINPHLGAPSAGWLNVRHEFDEDNSGKVTLYYLPADHRIHLLGADSWSFLVDYDNDGVADMAFGYEDTDGDGIIDSLLTDRDGDGVFEHRHRIAAPSPQFLTLDYAGLRQFYERVLAQAITEDEALIAALKRALAAREPAFVDDQVEVYFETALTSYRRDAGLGLKIKSSREGTRYYLDVIRERYFLRLLDLLGMNPAAAKLEAAYSAGDFAGVVAQLERM